MSSSNLKKPEYDTGELNGSSSSYSQRPPLRIASAGPPQDQQPSNKKQRIRIQKEQEKQQEQHKLQLASGNAEDSPSTNNKDQTEEEKKEQHAVNGETSRNSYTRRARHQTDEGKKKRHTIAVTPGAVYEPGPGAIHEQQQVPKNAPGGDKKRVSYEDNNEKQSIDASNEGVNKKNGTEDYSMLDHRNDYKEHVKNRRERRSSRRRSSKKKEKGVSQTSGDGEEASDSSDDDYDTEHRHSSHSSSSKKRAVNDNQDDDTYEDEYDRVGAVNVRGVDYRSDDDIIDDWTAAPRGTSINHVDVEQPSTGNGAAGAVDGMSASATNINSNDDGTILLEAELVEESEDKKKERERERQANIEARVQREMREREKGIRETLIVDVPQALPLSEDDKADDMEGGRKRTFMIIGAIVTIIVIVIAVVVAVTSGGATGSPAPRPTQPPVESPEQLRMLLVDLYSAENENLDDVNLDLILNEDGTMFRTTAPQDKAYQWLLEVDEQAQEAETESLFDTNDSQGILELYSLLVLYYSTNGENWAFQNGFLNTTIPPCQWQEERIASMGGVSCDPSGRIVGIELDNNNLNGTIPWELSLLTSLEHLTMSRNELRGLIPEAFGAKLARLDTLRLSQNRLSGTIPDSIGGLSEIKEIMLSDNAFTGPIPPKLLRNSGLERLDLSANKLNGTIPDLQTHSTTKGINLANNLLTGTIPVSMTKLNQLSSLNLEWNFLSGTLPTGFGQLGELEILSVSRNMFTGSVPEELKDADDLKHLWLDHNELDGSLSAELGRLDKLEWLALHHNKLTGELPAEIFDGLSLKYLELHTNRFQGTLPSTIASMTDLVIFFIQDNDFTGDIDALICNATSGIFVSDAVADCDDPAEVTCSCCVECCNDETGCPYDTGLKACERDVSTMRDDFDLLCACVPDAQGIVGKDDGGYMLTCDDPACQYCDDEGTSCASSSERRSYDPDGRLIRSWQTYEYFTGPHAGVEVALEYRYALNGKTCEVTADGQVCNYCMPLACSDGAESVEIFCDEFGNGARFNGCEVAESDSTGFLQAFHPNQFINCEVL